MKQPGSKLAVYLKWINPLVPTSEFERAKQSYNDRLANQKAGRPVRHKKKKGK